MGPAAAGSPARSTSRTVAAMARAVPSTSSTCRTCATAQRSARHRARTGASWSPCGRSSLRARPSSESAEAPAAWAARALGVIARAPPNAGTTLPGGTSSTSGAPGGVPSPGVPTPGVPTPGVPTPGVPAPGVPASSWLTRLLLAAARRTAATPLRYRGVEPARLPHESRRPVALRAPGPALLVAHAAAAYPPTRLAGPATARSSTSMPRIPPPAGAGSAAGSPPADPSTRSCT